MLALAAVCLLAGPSLSNPWDRGAAGVRHGEWLLLADDVTEEDLDNMTISEIRALEKQEMEKIQNMTPAEIRDLREQKRQETENLAMAETREQNQDRMPRDRNGGWNKMAGNFWGIEPSAGPDAGGCRTGCRMGAFEGLDDRMWMLLVDDETRDDLENMTLKEIDELRQQKVQELEGMTLSEIRELKVQKMQEFENATLSEVNDQGPRMNGRGGPFAGHQFRGGGRFR